MGKATWIWYYGDFELYHHCVLSLSRRERGSTIPAFWKVFDCHRLIKFMKEFELEKPETITVKMDGEGYIMLGRERLNCDKPIEVPAGKHHVIAVVGNLTGIPALHIEGESLFTDGTWLASDHSGNFGMAGFKPVGYWNLSDSEMKPTKFELPTERIEVVSKEDTGDGILYDFGRETYVKLVLEGTSVGDSIEVTYGESREEAMDTKRAVLSASATAEGDSVTFRAAACRYVRIHPGAGSEIKNVYGLYEYLPLETRGGFKCGDALINKIYDVADYTLRLNSRMFYLDGIKRDGWVWGGDAYQSYFLNYYCHFDRDIIKRTVLALRGGDPVVSFVNTIIDYTFLWFISLEDYYMYTGDEGFIKEIYESAKLLLDFSRTRINSAGLMEGRMGDWTFVDWADMNKRGALCIIQMLWCRALESMAVCAAIAGDSENAESLKKEAAAFRSKIDGLYWDSESGGYVTTVIDGTPVREIRRHQNIFAVLLGFADEEKKRSILKNVILNDAVPAITTPYFKFYELDALAKLGEMDRITEVIRSYWGGMLGEGATTFWEEYDPNMSGAEHLAMYGEPYDKSLCHAWGASPIYLFGRYYLGVYPTKPGYAEFRVEPRPGGLGEISGTVPVNGGRVEVSVRSGRAEVFTDVEGGIFAARDGDKKIVAGQKNIFEI